ncbi:MAG: DUF1738 domain-containing protein [Burkholderiales bacterium]|nr:DUF1738 domain-containing protein [Burkholderiales bacterium]
MSTDRKIEKPSFATRVAETVIQRLEEGTAPWQKPWEPGTLAAAMPNNPTTGRRYRGGNAMWLMLQGRGDPRWMTYKQAAGVGAQVRKGEKGTLIEYVQRTESRAIRDEAGNPVLDSEGRTRTETAELTRPKVFRAVVFNAEQIDGLPTLEQRPKHAWEVSEIAERALAASGVPLAHVNGNRAFYSVSEDKITLPEREQFPSPAGYYETALHELGHATGHESRLNRDLKHPFGSEGYAKEELRAELASLMLGERLGLGFDPGNHVAYVGSWIKVLKEDPREIFRAAADAERITTWVTERALTKEQLATLSEDREQRTQDNAQERAEAQDNAISGMSNREWLDVERARLIGAGVLEADSQARTSAIVEAIARHDGATVAEVQGDAWLVEQLVPAIAAYHDKEKVTRIYSGDDDEAKTPIEKRYGELVKAERAFESELTRVFGAEGNARRYDWRYEDAGLMKANEGFIEAGQNYSETLRAERAKLSQETPMATKTRTYLAVPFKEKDEAKEAALKAGFRLEWDKETKAWAAPAGADLTTLERWMPQVAQAKTMSPVDELTQHLRDRGFVLDGEAKMDGQRHRVPVVGDKGTERSGSYKAHIDGHPAAHVQNYKTGVNENWKWSGKASTVSAEDRARIAQEQEAKREAREAQDRAMHERTAKAIDELIAVAPRIEGHPYSARKAIEGPMPVVPENGNALPKDSPIRIAAGAAEAAALRKSEPDAIVLKAGDLLILAHDGEGKTRGAQWIDGDGRKGFVTGSQMSGSHFTMLAPNAQDKAIFITEGWATGKKIMDATNATTIVAFTAHNLEAVAKQVRDAYPNRPIVIAGDNDHEHEKDIVQATGAKRGNPGRDNAEAAAAAVSGYAATPVFAKGEKGTDWDDVAKQKGIGAVTKAMDEAQLLADRRLLQDAQMTGHDAERVAEVVKIHQAEQLVKKGQQAGSTTQGNYQDLRHRAEKEADRQDTSDEAPEPEEQEQTVEKKVARKAPATPRKSKGRAR